MLGSRLSALGSRLSDLRPRTYDLGPLDLGLPSLNVGDTSFRDHRPFLLLVSRDVGQWLDQSKVRVHRLEVAGVGFAHVAIKSAEHCRWRRDDRVVAA